MSRCNKYRSSSSLGFYGKKISIDNVSIGKQHSYGTVKSWSSKYKKAMKNNDKLYEGLVKAKHMVFKGNKIVNIKYDKNSSFDDIYVSLCNMWNEKFKIEKNRNMNREKLYKIESQRLKSSLNNIRKDTNVCTICFDNQIDKLCYPCGHLCVCSNCTKRINDSKCPICRKEVKEYVNVFHCN